MNRIRLSFLGQCLVFGYKGVPRSDTYPDVAGRRIELERPGLQVEIAREPFHHPALLGPQLERVLGSVPRPSFHVLVIDAAALRLAREWQPLNVGSLPFPLAWLGARARQALLGSQGLGHALPVVRAVLQPANIVGRLLAERHERPTIGEYEQYLDRAVRAVRETPRTAVVLQTPSLFNAGASHHDYAPDTVEIYRDVNAMVRRVGAAHQVPVLDRSTVAAHSDGRLFLNGRTLRLTRLGHEAMGHALADELLRLRLV